jgi:hypothetical protein
LVPQPPDVRFVQDAAVAAAYLEGRPIDLDSAEQFMLANARLLDRHRFAVLLRGAPVAPVLDALR